MPFLIILIIIVVVAICFYWYINSDYYELVAPPTIIASLVIVFGIGILTYDYSKTEERTILVEHKDRGGEDGSYRVYTDSDTLAVSDIWFSFSNRRTNSADLYGDIEVCHRYEVTTRGWEFGALSMMPNIDRIVKDLGMVEGCIPKD
jgi:hypothetical protein